MSDTTFLISGGFFDAVDSDRLYSADQMNQPYKKLIHDGINREADGSAPGFAVTAGGGMNVLVATGNAMIGGKWAENKAVQTIAVAGNTSGSARIDSIILQCDKSRAVRAVQIVYRQGTTTAPDLVSDNDVTELRLANIRVPSAASAIASENITDTRGGAECPWVRSVFDAPDARYIVEEYTGTELAGAYQTVKSAVDSIRYAAQSGQPTVALQASDMIDSDLVYLYQGSETGYSAGYLYYYSDAAGAWIRGAQYGASVVDTGLDADSENPVQNKAVTAAIAELNGRLGDLSDLETVDKTNLVEAINEAARSGGGTTPVSPYKNAKILAFGDSICYGANSVGSSYPELTAAKLGITSVENRGWSGAVLQKDVRSHITGNIVHSICDDIDYYSAKDADIILLGGGYNDITYIQSGVAAWGELTVDFTSTLDLTTLCGALEYILRKSITLWSNKAIIFVLVHRPDLSADREKFRKCVKDACSKYGVPVADVGECSPTFQSLPFFESNYIPDGVHPSLNGYKAFYVPLITHSIEKYFKGTGTKIALTDSTFPNIIVDRGGDEPEKETTSYEFENGFVRTNGTINTTSTNYKFTNLVEYTGGDLSLRIADYSNNQQGVNFAALAFFDSNRSYLGTIASTNFANTNIYYNYSGSMSYDFFDYSMTENEIYRAYPGAAYFAVSSLSESNPATPTAMWTLSSTKAEITK